MRGGVVVGDVGWVVVEWVDVAAGSTVVGDYERLVRDWGDVFWVDVGAGSAAEDAWQRLTVSLGTFQKGRRMWNAHY